MILKPIGVQSPPEQCAWMVLRRDDQWRRWRRNNPPAAVPEDLEILIGDGDDIARFNGSDRQHPPHPSL